MKKPKKKIKPPSVRVRGSTCPCPSCGKPSHVVRTTRGARLREAPRDHVLRERRCIGPARHRFHTEERPK